MKSKKFIMKKKYIRTAFYYIGSLIFSWSIFIKNGLDDALGMLGTFLILSVFYLALEYRDW